MQRRLSNTIRTSFFSLALCAAVACASAARADSDDGSAQDPPSTQALIQKLLPPIGDELSKLPLLQVELATFYDARNFKPVWSGDDDASARAASLKAVLAHADQQGLNPAVYLATLTRWKDAPAPGEDAAEYDIEMTAALFRYAADVRLGRVQPTAVYKDVSLPAEQFDPGAVLTKALRHDKLDAYLADLAPVHPGYGYLAEALAHYRAIAAAGGWPAIHGDGFALDGSDKREALLAKRLAFEDPILAANTSPTDTDIADAVVRFEKRNGLKADGKVGPELLRVLDIPAAARVKTIEANMERWRWLPRYLEPHYIEVNVPDQSVEYIDDGTIALYSPIIIGKPSTPTPILRTEVQAVVANPPWHIPGDLFVRKFLPRLRHNHDYLTAHNMMLAALPPTDPQTAAANDPQNAAAGDPQSAAANAPQTVALDWRKVNASYQFEQAPGADNALGTIMLDMPNPFDVYLHDTPEKKLFTLDDREKSNGCMRVEQINQLASLVLSGGDSSDSDDLKQAIATNQTQRLALDKPLPVYVLYWTAIAGPNGAIDFRPDRYGRDAQLIARLDAQPEKAKPALELVKPKTAPAKPAGKPAKAV